MKLLVISLPVSVLTLNVHHMLGTHFNTCTGKIIYFYKIMLFYLCYEAVS